MSLADAWLRTVTFSHDTMYRPIAGTMKQIDPIRFRFLLTIPYQSDEESRRNRR